MSLEQVLADARGEAAVLRGLPWAPDDILTDEDLGARLKVSPDTVAKMDLPHFYAGRGKLRRYIWGQVVETLRHRAETAA